MPAPPAIVVEALAKHFDVPVREPGIAASLRSFVRRRTRTVRAVDGVSFELQPGEIVGFLGPNGAGKTTALKMLSGLLHPTSGHARVLGHTPHRRERDFLCRISLVMGQRQQLSWDIPAADSFEMLRAIYDIPGREYRAALAELTELLDLEPLLDKPVRQLSLGERMKCELAGALLHRPDVLFLDEPTLGLDVGAQRRIRDFIHDHRDRTGATVVLTSHYMTDIEALARRVIVIHHGRLQYDGPLHELAQRVSDRKLVTVRTRTADEAVIEVPAGEIRERLGELLARDDLIDFTVEDEPIEQVIERVFAHGVERGHAT